MSKNGCIGYIGIGNMGEPMALRLLAAGFDVSVWGRTGAKLERVIGRGASLRAAPGEVAEYSDIVFLCVSDTEAVRDVVLGEDGIVQGGAAGMILVDMSTIAPDATVSMAAELAERCGMSWVDAPVSGGTVGAEAGTLAVMAGGEEADIERLRPVLAHLARNVTRMGPVGAGQKTKLINQTIVGCTLAVLAEALALAVKSGVDAAALPKALQGGRADSTMLQQLLPGLVREDYTLTSTLRSMIKDLNLIQALATQTDTPMPVTGLVTQLHRLLAHRQHADEDVTTLYRLYGTSRLG